MEASSPSSAGAISGRRGPGRGLRQTPTRRVVFLGVMALVALWLIATYGLNAFGQRSVNGVVTGSYLALGAIGLTLVYGILRLANFAHGDMLTLGAYIALFFNVTLGVPFVVALARRGPAHRRLRRRSPSSSCGGRCDASKAGTLQLVLMTIGLAFVIRNVIQIVAGAGQQRLDVNTTDTFDFLGLTIGAFQLVVVIVAFAVLTAVALMLRVHLARPPDAGPGRQLRPRRDDRDRHRSGRDLHLDPLGRPGRPGRRPGRRLDRQPQSRTPASPCCCRCSRRSCSVGSATPSAPWPEAW